MRRARDAEKNARREDDNTIPDAPGKTAIQKEDNTMKTEESVNRRSEDGDGTEYLDSPKRCRHCGDDAVVPVKDKQFEPIHRRGNPYRQYCLSCEKHICMCSREVWEEHPDRFILSTPTAEPTPVFDCPGCDELVEGYLDECPHCGVEYEW